ncbi:CatA-like O-acetyltransferase [Cryobacterium sp. LW097]|uniref:CatA-like O-acetyltransferase n=1 Tax=Cryobacterium sp. LW097 TaxID=1978566 RepID=UPI003516515B
MVHPAFTVFNPERETFANVWSPFHADFPTFCEHTADVLAKYRTRRFGRNQICPQMCSTYPAFRGR